MGNRWANIALKTGRAIAKATLIALLVLAALFQGMVVFTSYYSRQLASFVTSGLRSHWPRMVHVQRIQFAWYHLLPTVFFNDIRLDDVPKLAGVQVQPGFNVGIDIMNFAALCNPDWALGTVILQNAFVILPDSSVISSMFQNDREEDNREEGSGSALRIFKAMLRGGSCVIKNSKIALYQDKALLLDGKIKRARLTNADAKHRLVWSSNFGGQLLHGNFRGELQIFGDFNSKKLLSPRVFGQLYLSDYRVDTDALSQFAARLRPKTNDSISPSAESLEKAYHLLGASLKCRLRNGVIQYSGLPQPWRLSDLRWDLEWSRHDNCWHMLRIGLRDAYLMARGRADLLIADRWQDTELRVLADLSCNDVSKLRNYYPTADEIIPKDGLSWLNQAFVGGKVSHGRLSFKGKLGNFPFENSQDEYFRVALNVNKIRLRYDADWPILDEVDGKVLFSGGSMWVDTEHASIMGVKLGRVTAEIKNLEHPELKIDGFTLTELPKLVQFVNSTPLKSKVGKRLSRLNAQGRALLKLQLALPLWQTPMDVSVKGKVAISEGKMAVKEVPFAIEQIDGEIKFDQNGILPSKMVGKFLDDHLINLSVRSIGDKGAVAIASHSTLLHADLKRLWPDANWEWLGGRFPLKAEIVVPETDDNYQAQFTSNLNGLQINLPAPLAKRKQEKIPFKIICRKQGDDMTISGSYRDLQVDALRLQQKQREWQIVKGTINVGAINSDYRTASDHGANLTGLAVNVKQDSLDIAPWMEWWKTGLSGAQTGSAQMSSAKQGGGNGASVLALPDNLKIKAKIGRLIFVKRKLGALDVTYSKNRQQLAVSGSADGLKGEFIWPSDLKQSAALRLELLDLDKLTAMSEFWSSNSEDGSEKALLPRQPCDISIGKLMVKGQEYTRLKTRLISTGVNQADFHDLMMWWGDVRITGDGHIRLAGSGRPINMSWRGKMQCDDLGKHLMMTNLTDHLAQGSGHMDVELKYKAPERGDVPFFDLKYLTGSLQGEVSNGAIVNLEEDTMHNVNVGKMVNAFSIESLFRRFVLNFKDITKEGLFFHDANITCKVLGNELKIERLGVRSPVADLAMQGSLQLDKRHYDLKLQVMPHMTKSIPLAAMLVGGPVVGAISLVADTVATAAMDKIIKYDYNLVGDW